MVLAVRSVRLAVVVEVVKGFLIVQRLVFRVQELGWGTGRRNSVLGMFGIYHYVRENARTLGYRGCQVR